MIDIIVRYLHFIFLFGMVTSLVVENVLIKPVMTREEMKRMGKVDRIYGAFAAGVLLTGIALWFWVGKPAPFYSKNMLFMIKITIFLMGAVLSIYPSVFYAISRKSSTDTINVRGSVFAVLHISLILIVTLPLLAVMMAAGIGL